MLSSADLCLKLATWQNKIFTHKKTTVFTPWFFVMQIGVCRTECKMQNAKCTMLELRCNYNKTNLVHCRGRSLCLPVTNRKPCGRARRPDPTLQPIWCIDNISTNSNLLSSFILYCLTDKSNYLINTCDKRCCKNNICRTIYPRIYMVSRYIIIHI